MTDLTHPATGEPLPAIIDVPLAASILGESERYVSNRCRLGQIATMPRVNDAGAWKIITAKLLRQLGLYEASA